MDQKSIADAAPLVEASHVFRHYDIGNVNALSDVSFRMDAGQYLAIIGKSGSGKTTLLNMIGGLDRPTSGEMRFAGQVLRGSSVLDRHRAQNVGFVFQSYYLLPNLTAKENVQIPMFQSAYSAIERAQRAVQLLTQVGLAGRENHLPAQLSGGECQRVAIARALANGPRLILADEPTGALDTESGSSVLDLLESLHRSEGVTLIIVTHDESVAMRAQTRLRMADGHLVAASNHS